MHVLLEAPEEDYFIAVKLVSNKNKAIEELSPYAKQFVKAFLSQKANFVKASLLVVHTSGHMMRSTIGWDCGPRIVES